MSLILGCMFSGKTTELIRRIQRCPPGNVLVIKHDIDIRFSRDAIVSHSGKALPAVVVSRGREIFSHLRAPNRAVAVDEGHFFEPDFATVVEELCHMKIDVLVASLEPDSWGRPFSVNAHLRGLADETLVLTAHCARCGAAADRTQRLTPIIGGDMVVDPSNYESRCQACWRPPTVTAHLR